MTTTLNGKPLDVVLEEERSAEIQEVREEEIAVPLNRHTKTRPSTNLSRARTLPGVVVYAKGQKASHVVMRRTVFPYESKAPFAKSGMSALGALVYSEADDTIQCHECGEFFRNLGRHVISHAIDARQYKESHALAASTPLLSPGVLQERSENSQRNWLNNPVPAFRRFRETQKSHKRPKNAPARIGRRSVELANLKSQCKAQLTERLLQMAQELGKCPTVDEVVAGDALGRIYGDAVKFAFGCSTHNALLSIGLTPVGRGSAGIPNEKKSQAKASWWAKLSPTQRTRQGLSISVGKRLVSTST